MSVASGWFGLGIWTLCKDVMYSATADLYFRKFTHCGCDLFCYHKIFSLRLSLSSRPLECELPIRKIKRVVQVVYDHSLNLTFGLSDLELPGIIEFMEFFRCLIKTKAKTLKLLRFEIWF
jgi:hypothetical protein